MCFSAASICQGNRVHERLRLKIISGGQTGVDRGALTLDYIDLGVSVGRVLGDGLQLVGEIGQRAEDRFGVFTTCDHKGGGRHHVECLEGTDQEIVVSVPGHSPASVGSMQSFSAPPDALHLFDTQTQKRIA